MNMLKFGFLFYSNYLNYKHLETKLRKLEGDKASEKQTVLQRKEL
jgi:hypothetical protein